MNLSRAFAVALIMTQVILHLLAAVPVSADDAKTEFRVEKKLNGEDTGEIVLWSPNGKFVVSTLTKGLGDNYALRSWDTSTWTEDALVTDHTSAIRSMTFNPDGTLLITASVKLIIYETGNWQVRKTIEFENITKISSVSWNEHTNLIALSFDDGNVKVLDADDWSEVKSFRGVDVGPGGPIAWDPAGEMLAQGQPDGSIRIWNYPQVGKTVHDYRKHSDGMLSDLMFDASGARLYSTGFDSRIVEYTLSTRKAEVIGSHGIGQAILDIEWDPVKNRVITSGDYKVVIWDASVPLWAFTQMIESINGQDFDKVYRTAWAPDGKRFVSVQPGVTYLWTEHEIRTDEPFLPPHQVFGLVMAAVAVICLVVFFAGRSAEGKKRDLLAEEDEKEEDEEVMEEKKQRIRKKDRKRAQKKSWSKE